MGGQDEARERPVSSATVQPGEQVCMPRLRLAPPSSRLDGIDSSSSSSGSGSEDERTQASEPLAAQLRKLLYGAFPAARAGWAAGAGAGAAGCATPSPQHLRFLLVASGTRGDVEPNLALACALREAGHESRMMADARYRGFVEARGVAFAALPPVNVRVEACRLTGKVLRRRFNIEPQLEAVRREARMMSPSWMLLNVLDVAALAIAREQRIPCAGTFYAPLSRTSDWAHTHAAMRTQGGTAPPPVGGRSRAYTAALRARQGAPSNHNLESWLQEEELHAFADEFRLGMPRGALGMGQLHWMHRAGVPVLYGFSELVVPPPADWPTNVSVTGYWRLPPLDGWSPPEALARFLDAGLPPVFVGYGSISAEDSTARFSGRDNQGDLRLVIETLMLSDRRVVFYGVDPRTEAARRRGGGEGAAAAWRAGSSGVREKLPPELFLLDGDMGTTRGGGVPFSWLFERCACVCHHGGASTTSTALFSGTPQVIVPHAFDQGFWADRVQSLGCGVRIDARRLTARSLADAWRHAERHADAARDLAKRLADENGGRRAVTALERLTADVAGLRSRVSPPAMHEERDVGCYWGSEDDFIAMWQNAEFKAAYEALPDDAASTGVYPNESDDNLGEPAAVAGSATAADVQKAQALLAALLRSVRDDPSAESIDTVFEVVHRPVVIVRAEPSLSAPLVGMRRYGERVRANGRTPSGWVRVASPDGSSPLGGWMLLRHETYGVLLRPVGNGDGTRIQQ